MEAVFKAIIKADFEAFQECVKKEGASVFQIKCKQGLNICQFLERQICNIKTLRDFYVSKGKPTDKIDAELFGLRSIHTYITALIHAAARKQGLNLQSQEQRETRELVSNTATSSAAQTQDMSF